MLLLVLDIESNDEYEYDDENEEVGLPCADFCPLSSDICLLATGGQRPAARFYQLNRIARMPTSQQ